MSEEEEAIQELKSMTREEIDLVPYTNLKWICSGKKCNNGTKVRDYGIHPEYWSQRLKEPFFSINKTFWMCGKHWKLYKRISKNYSQEHVYRKIFNFSKPRFK